MKTIFTLAVALVVAACAVQGYEPIVDRGHPEFNQARYSRDLAQCRQYADQVSPAEGAFAGGLLGALVGAGIGAATGGAMGDAGKGALIGTAAGGSTGIIAGAGAGIADQVSVIRNCLRGRGHAVLR